MPREYQHAAVGSLFPPGGKPQSGVITLACGAGKSLVGIMVAARLRRSTLILCTTVTAAEQFERELLRHVDAIEVPATYGGSAPSLAIGRTIVPPELMPPS